MPDAWPTGATGDPEARSTRRESEAGRSVSTGPAIEAVIAAAIER